MQYVLVAIALALAGCASSNIETRKSLLAEPVNCPNAKEDIAALEAAMPSKGERARSALQTATPIGALAGVVTGSYRDRAAVLTGRTQDELQARIKEIQVTCGITQTSMPSKP